MGSDQSFTLESENEDPNPEINKKDITYDDWVLVQYRVPKGFKHFVGQVQDVDNDIANCFQIKFLRRCKEHFVWPQTDDIDVVLLKDIVTRLPNPVLTRRGALRFSVKFAGYNI